MEEEEYSTTNIKFQIPNGIRRVFHNKLKFQIPNGRRRVFHDRYKIPGP